MIMSEHACSSDFIGWYIVRMILKVGKRQVYMSSA